MSSRKSNPLAIAAACASLSLGGVALAGDSRGPGATSPEGADVTQGGTVSHGDSLDLTSGPEAATSRDKGEASDRRLAGIRKVLAQATDAAVSEDGFSRLTALLSRPDRKRIGGDDAGEDAGDNNRAGSSDRAAGRAANGAIPKDDASALRERVRQFRQDWKEKYGRDFGVANQEVVFSGVRLDAPGGTATAARGNAADVAGEGAGTAAARDATGDAEPATGDAQPAAARTRGSSAGEARIENAPARDARTFEKRVSEAGRDDARAARGGPAGTTSTTSSERSKQGDAEAPLGGHASDGARTDDAADSAPASRSVAIVIPPPRGAQDVHLRVVSEASGGWRIDVPDSVDRRQMAAALGRHLEAIQREKGNWPENPDDAARLVSHHVLAALTETAAANGGAAPQTTR